MEVIRLSGYTEDEKIAIAQQYLLPKQMKNNGIKEDELHIAESALRDITRYYTREAGVRSLEREISRSAARWSRGCCCARPKASRAMRSIRWRSTRKNLDKYLGVRRFTYGIAEKKNQIGQVTGLAWTEVGGEPADHRSRGAAWQGQDDHDRQTGRCDERVDAGRAFGGAPAARSSSASPPDFYQKTDLHVHLPEGATPKDGPSAGIAICTAMVSILTGIPVRADVAMTGEITLRGEVLPIGGLEGEAARRRRVAGSRRVLIPEENVKDLVEISDEIKNRLDIHPVRWIEHVLEQSLERQPEPAAEPIAAGEAAVPAAPVEEPAAIIKH